MKDVTETSKAKCHEIPPRLKFTVLGRITFMYSVLHLLKIKFHELHWSQLFRKIEMALSFSTCILTLVLLYSKMFVLSYKLFSALVIRDYICLTFSCADHE